MSIQCTLKTGTGRWILAATTLASATAFLSGSVVALALPSIQREFATNVSGLQWVVNGSLLTLGALLLIGGALGDNFGRKRIFLAGLAVFTIATILSGFAPSIGYLIAFQVIQGIGSALMVPQSLAIINDCFAENERGRAIGLWAGISGGIAALGPFLGGWLIDTFSWRAVFFLGVFISVPALVITTAFVPAIKSPGRRQLDWPGTALIFVGLSGLAYGLISGPVAGWSHLPVIISLAGGAAAVLVFVLVERSRSEALVPFELFRNPLVTGANIVTLFLYFALNGTLFFTVLNLQQIQGYAPTTAGISLLPTFVLITVLSGPAGALADKIGPRLQMIAGPAIVAAGMALLTTGGSQANYFIHFLPGLSLFGIGMALVIAPLTKCALSVEPRFSGAASGFNNATARVAGLLAVAVLGAITLATFTARLESNVSLSDLTAPEQRLILNQADRLGGIEIPVQFNATARQASRSAIDESFVFGFRWAMGICSALAAASAIVAVFTIKNTARRNQSG